MANFNRDNRSGSNRSFGKPKFNRERPDMHKATCANCGKVCEVPFKPTGSKPVLCNDCFKNERGDSPRSENRNFGRTNSEDRQMFDAICANCGKNCQIPFRPNQGRDVFCSRCFENNEGSESKPEHRTFDKPSFRDNSQRTNDEPNYKAQFEALNAKMDHLIRLLTPTPLATPLDSVIDEKVIEDITNEVEKEKTETVEEKPKKAKDSKKTASQKKK